MKIIVSQIKLKSNFKRDDMGGLNKLPSPSLNQE